MLYIHGHPQPFIIQCCISMGILNLSLSSVIYPLASSTFYYPVLFIHWHPQPFINPCNTSIAIPNTSIGLSLSLSSCWFHLLLLLCCREREKRSSMLGLSLYRQQKHSNLIFLRASKLPPLLFSFFMRYDDDFFVCFSLSYINHIQKITV